MVLLALKLMWMCYGFHPINVETLLSLILNHGFGSLKSDFNSSTCRNLKDLCLGGTLAPELGKLAYIKSM